MATVHNPTDYNLFCHALRRSVAPGKTERISDEVAATIPTLVFEVTRDEKSAAPVRKAAKRGGKVAEVTEVPAKETR